MNDWLINISDLPEEGREFSFADPGFWTGRFAEHGMSCATIRPLEAEAEIQPQGDGALVRGTLRGSVRLACDRCAANFEFPVRADFEHFESPAGPDEPAEDSRVRDAEGILLLDMGAVLWEEFVLALPVKPLCSEACKGICPQCGQNLNEGACDCTPDEGDPRLAVFRTLKLK